jgi:glutamine amidotransferase
MTAMIVVIDYGLGNVGSIRNMLVRCGASAIVSSDPDDVLAADKLILPGVGSFDTGMSELRASGLLPVLTEAVRDRGVPVLGICLGMQMLGRRSDEGRCEGLGWLDAETVRLSVPADFAGKVPHMGWSSVHPRRDHVLLSGLGEEPEFYFSHSYALSCSAPEAVVAVASYPHEFPVVVEQGNVMGVQFHPEKSHRAGLSLFRNFAAAA